MLRITIEIPDAGEEAAQKEGGEVVGDKGKSNSQSVDD